MIAESDMGDCEGQNEPALDALLAGVEAAGSNTLPRPETHVRRLMGLATPWIEPACSSCSPACNPPGKPRLWLSACSNQSACKSYRSQVIDTTMPETRRATPRTR
jgi:hypothetical protein